MIKATAEALAKYTDDDVEATMHFLASMGKVGQGLVDLAANNPDVGKLYGEQWANPHFRDV